MSAGALGRQFWRANPNQMALPGFEEHAHPGAPLLAKGYRFVTHDADLGSGHVQHELNVVHPSLERNGQGLSPHRTFAGAPGVAASMNWTDTGGRAYGAPGEIGMIETAEPAKRLGLATALYGVGRQLARVKPRHSAFRTPEGNAWAITTTNKYGGRVPKKNDFGSA